MQNFIKLDSERSAIPQDCMETEVDLSVLKNQIFQNKSKVDAIKLKLYC